MVKKISFGKKLRYIRLQCGLSCEQLAVMAGTTARGIRLIESGTVKSPNLNTAMRIVKALKVSLAEFDDCIVNEQIRRGSKS